MQNITPPTSTSTSNMTSRQRFLQNKLKVYINKLPFFRAVRLFEQQKNLSLCYDLFMECALTGNCYALFYIKHLQDHFSFVVNKKDNFIVNNLEYFLQNVPIIDNVRPEYWLEVSLIKQKLTLGKKEQKDAFKSLFNLAPYCTAGYILLQKIIYNYHIKSKNISLTERWIKKLKSIYPAVIDLFMMAHIKNDVNYNNRMLTGTYFFADLNRIVKFIKENGIESYKFHGQLERSITHLEYYGIVTRASTKGLYRCVNKQYDQAHRKIRWQRTGAFMGNDQLYMMFSSSTRLDEENKMKNALFASLSGNLYCKVNTSQLMLGTHASISQRKSVAKIINPQLGEEWLLSFCELTIQQAMSSMKKNLMLDQDISENVSNTYINCGKMLESYAKKTTENELKQKYLEKAFRCYLRAAKLGNPVGFFNAGIFYEYNMLNNDLGNETNIKLAIGMYSKAFDLHYQKAANRLISLNYNAGNYEQVYKYINELILKKINILSFEDHIPIIYAHMVKCGLGSFAVDKDLAYKIIIGAAKLGNNNAKFEVIRDFIDEKQFAKKLLTSTQLLNMGLDLYNSLPKLGDGDQFKINLTAVLAIFFAKQDFVERGGREIALQLINQGLLENNIAIKAIFAEYNLYGNRNLNIAENGSIALRHLNQLLQIGGSIVEENMPVIYNQMGIAYMRGVGLNADYILSEQYLQQAYQLHADYAGYNLSCLYFKMNQFSKAFEYLKEALDEYPEDSDVLCDIATHYLWGLGVEANFELAKIYTYKSFELRLHRSIPNYVIINIFDIFINENSTLNLANCEKLLSEYISSSEFTKHNDKGKNFLYLLEAGLTLLNKPFQYPIMVRKLKLIEGADYFIEFAIKYLENKPCNRDVNYLGIDLLYIIFLSDECLNILELEKAFNANGLFLQLNQSKSIKPSQENTNKNIANCNKIDKFKEELARFIHKDPKAKISFKDLKKLCFVASVLFPDKAPCKISHAKNGSGEKIELGETRHHAKSLILFHPEHRSGRRREEKPDPKRRKAIEKGFRCLQYRMTRLRYR